MTTLAVAILTFAVGLILGTCIGAAGAVADRWEARRQYVRDRRRFDDPIRNHRMWE